MVTDNRSASPRQPVVYDGYDPLPIVDLKVHMLIDPGSGKRDGFLRVITEGGIEGWSNGLDSETAWLITTQFRECLIGRDALERERLWHDLVMLERLTWPPKKLRGAIDIALWDHCGQAVGDAGVASAGCLSRQGALLPNPEWNHGFRRQIDGPLHRFCSAGQGRGVPR